MSDISRLNDEKHSLGRLVLPSLVISNFVTMPPGILAELLLIDIALTFGCPVGIMGQVITLSSSLAVISALLVGALSVRFKPKSLLTLGLLFFSISALGCFLAPNFNTMLLAYSISGLGMAMVSPMSFTLVADYFPLEKRPSAIGWISAGAALSYFIGAPVIGFIADLGGWRLAFLGFVLPISLLGLLLAVKGLPYTSSHQSATWNSLEGFKNVFSNTSAVACLVGSALASGAFQAVLIYSSSFYRQRFLVSTVLASIFIIASALCYTLGSLASGRFVKRFGMKPLTVLTAFFAGIFIISYANLPILWLSVAVKCLGSLFTSMMFTASTSLTLEQVPEFRGTMMSISSATASIGSALGAAVGGWVLLLYDYEAVGISLGAMMVAAAIIFYLLVEDPTRT